MLSGGVMLAALAKESLQTPSEKGDPGRAE